ncbi:hypothetical protein ACGFT2_27325 [Streptomyces sp. NPDC048514]|uniref:hypothetical protein n=1 Tax=Streptomyces sp. NPDC048514 TaxID=3365564 RepID=UPI003721E677
MTSAGHSLAERRLARVTKDQRRVWYFLACRLFGIHFPAVVRATRSGTRNRAGRCGSGPP